jgi:plasmid stabilization system protein ParE
MNVRMIPLARREMLRAARWYERRAQGLGDRFLDEVRLALIAMREYPLSGSPVNLLFRRKLLDTFPYALIYRVDEDDIVIVAVAHLRRRPGYWLRRADIPDR